MNIKFYQAAFFLVVNICFSLSISAQHTNVLISSANQPNEPSIFISPVHPDTMIAASNIANYYLSYDAGYTWSAHTLTSTFGVWGDPVIIADTLGHFYFFHLSNPPSGNWIDRIVCQKTTNGGATWNNGSHFGLNGSKAQDKHWVVVDRNTNILYATWTEFDSYGSTSTSCKSKIMFSKSIDGGNTWTAALKINETDGNCIDSDETTEGAVPAIGPNGEIYVSWAGPDGLVFDKSIDGGLTWLANDIFVDGFAYGWDLDIPGIGRANGMPITKCDLSGGPNHGTIYINWADQSNGLENTDIWLSKSTNGGNTWSSPERVNQDNTQTHQFFTWMDIDQSTGYLYFVYYDRRAYTNNQTDVYLAYSVDGGETFKEEKISDSPFLPTPGIFFGDYNNINVNKGVIRPIWTRLHSNALSVYTAIIDTSLLDFTPSPLDTFIVNDTIIVTDTVVVNDTLFITDTLFIDGDTVLVYDTIYLGLNQKDVFEIDFQNYPNPTEDKIFFSFKLHETAEVNLTIYNAFGNKVLDFIKAEKLNYGKHVFSLNSREKGLPPGTYFYILQIDGFVYKKKSFVIL